MDFYAEGILQARILTPDYKLYENNSLSKEVREKYGARRLPEVYSKGLGYTFVGLVKYQLNYLDFKSYQSCPYRFTSDDALLNNLHINKLIKGSATSVGNNCLLDSCFQLINDFLRKNQARLLDDFNDFVNYIRIRLNKVNNEMLSINDEEEGVGLLSAIQFYLRDKLKLKANFDLYIFVPDSDGNLGMLDNLHELENQVNHERGTHIPIRIIHVNHNHYEPLFLELNNIYENDQNLTTGSKLVKGK